jgi:hypothetical protein
MSVYLRTKMPHQRGVCATHSSPIGLCCLPQDEGCAHASYLHHDHNLGVGAFFFHLVTATLSAPVISAIG